MTINIVSKIDDQVKIANVLLSVSDKSGLETLVPELRRINPDIRFYSTGGTFQHIRGLLGDTADECLIQVSDYTGQPETQGGLVKTLDFKIYLGLLTETYNDAHQADLQRTRAVALDMVVVNLYPFKQTVEQPDVTLEKARGNIDIGGPCMLRAAAKNFLRVAPLVKPDDYVRIIDELTANQGRLSLTTRFQLARTAFLHTAAYDVAIAEYMTSQHLQGVADAYGFEYLP